MASIYNPYTGVPVQPWGGGWGYERQIEAQRQAHQRELERQEEEQRNIADLVNRLRNNVSAAEVIQDVHSVPPEEEKVNPNTCEKCKKTNQELSVETLLDMKFKLCRRCYNDSIAFAMSHPALVEGRLRMKMFQESVHVRLGGSEEAIKDALREYALIAALERQARNDLGEYVYGEVKKDVVKRKEMVP